MLGKKWNKWTQIKEVFGWAKSHSETNTCKGEKKRDEAIQKIKKKAFISRNIKNYAFDELFEYLGSWLNIIVRHLNFIRNILI